ncbi:EAL domain-containing response regulator [Vibrio sp. SCSIO 43136]|uniref:two-component system response regulator n=1 Tax=Vibrio sp. SCSIO 43136 TaxID=2819101 RepID=UPI0020754B4E|nr:EAL domain-containing response regulator [Vibrio sp. SCSIO 43136]USD67134.1 EAL domain-containing response regulator [Vibrio sp. SCSIO 43136]
MTTILIVEDDNFQRNVTQAMLNALTDAEILLASNGLEACQIVNESVPDVIFCDLMMPEMDGVEFAKRLASLAPNCALVFISSAENDIQQAVVDMASRSGLTHVTNLAKPIHKESLCRVLAWATRAPKTEKKPQRQPEFNLDFDDLHKAINQLQILPHFQPHYNAASQSLVGAEALMRWEHPEYGLLTPNHFLPQLLAGKYAYRTCIHILRQAIHQASRWHQMGWPLQIAVNVTPSDMAQPDFSDRVLEILDQARFPAAKLTLEVTEVELSPDVVKSLESSSRLRMHGVQVSIDDFGTGHSSLLQLISSPFTELKIDQMFVSQMLTSRKHLAAIRSVIDLGNNLGLNIVAEGVESQAQAECLARMGCDTLQGFALGYPMAAQDFEKLCRQYFSQRTLA